MNNEQVSLVDVPKFISCSILDARQCSNEVQQYERVDANVVAEKILD